MTDGRSIFGPIPDGWTLGRLGHLTAKIGSGATPRGGEATYLPSRENFALIRSQCVHDRRFDQGNLSFISDEQAHQLRNAEVRSGDVLLNITGDGVTFSRSALVPDDVLPACVNQHVAIVRADAENLSPKFLVSFLTHPMTKPYIESFNAGGSRRAITKGHIENFEIPLPPLDEQIEIGEFLSRLDDKIDLNRRINETLEVIAQAVFRDWFVDFGPTQRKMEGATDPVAILGGLIPNPEEAASLAALFPASFGDGGLPDGWKNKTLGDFDVELESGRRPKGGIDKSLQQGVPSLGAESVHEVGVFDGSKLKYVPEDFANKASAGWVQDYDVAVYKDGANVGDPKRVALFGGGFPFGKFMVNEHVFLVRSKSLGQPFLYSLFKSARVSGRLEKLGRGKAAQPGLNQKEVFSCDFVVPGSELIAEFNRLTLPSVSLRLHNGKENQTLAATRDLLLPKLMSGEIRLRAEEAIA